ncbi:MAG: hypothetical protein QM635_08500 [Microbacteriaceae bacterium]
MTITLHLPDLLEWTVLLSVAAGVFGLWDGVLRLRGSRLLGIVEVVVAALMLSSIFFDFGLSIPLTTLAVVLVVVLVVSVFLRGDLHSGSIAVTVIALVATALLLLTLLGWLQLPSLRG